MYDFFLATSAHDNVTEELFVLASLRCSLAPGRGKVSINICIPQRGDEQEGAVFSGVILMPLR